MTPITYSQIRYLEKIPALWEAMEEKINAVSNVARSVLLALGVALALGSCILAFTVHPLFGCGIAIAIACIGIRSLLPDRSERRLHKEAKLFYHKVLPHGKRRAEFDGNNRWTSINSIKDDLKEYVKEHPHKKALYEPLMQQFEQALHTLHSPIDEIMESIQTLAEGKSLILPGGCQKHAVLYVITKEQDERYRFTIINTGFGLRKADIMVDETGQMEMPPNGRMNDCSYNKLKKETLSQEFIQRLMIKKYDEKDMQEVNRFIEETLYNPNERNWQLGRMHKQQSNGTCTMSCLLAYLRNALGKEEYQQFKKWMIAHAIRHFENTLRTHNPKNPVYKEMLEESYKLFVNLGAPLQ